MPRPPENYELTARSSRSPSPRHASLDSPDGYRLSTSSRSSISSSINELDPHKAPNAPYRDDASASQPLTPGLNTASYSPSRRKGWKRWLFPSRMCCWMVLLFVVAFVLLLGAGGIWVYKVGGVPDDGQSDPWYPSPRGGTIETWRESYEKAAAMVAQMTLVEKVNVTSGTGWMMGMCVGNTGPVDRLGFPSLCLQDGPLGIRFADNITAFPAGVTVGATWNKDLMYQRGRAHGLEARLKGVNVLLGPGMGPLGRLPGGGRNWEGFGADPVLQGLAAAATISGIQAEGVMATAKHLVGNEQEHFRQSWEWGTPNAISSNMDDRTLHEIYAWPFAESVRAGVASVMCSYNQLNNSYACQNSKLLNGILKDEMGFQGFVQSDWLAQRSGVASALAGLDMTMPGDGLIWQDGVTLWGGELTKAVLNTSVPVERINDMALRIVAAWYQLGQDNTELWPTVEDGGGPNFSSWTNDETGLLRPGSDDKSTAVVNKFVKADADGEHATLVRKIAAEGIVMVKNDYELLPLKRNGSEMTNEQRKYRIGIYGEDGYNNRAGPNACPDRSCNVGTLAMGWGSGAVEFPYLVAPADALHNNFDHETVTITDHKTSGTWEAVDDATDQDLCIVFISADAGEGFEAYDGIKGDRNDLYPQKEGGKLVARVAAKCGAGGTAPVLVVLHSVGPVILEEFIDIPNVKAVLLAHLPGQESGNALADVIFGDINPSGRLPYTIAKREEDYGPTSKILYTPNGIVPQQNFSEGVFIDYRYLDANAIVPRYEFGFGMSYTSFRLSSLLLRELSMTRALLPEPRPVAALEPPTLDTDLPPAGSAVFPPDFRKLKKYIYPYITSSSAIKTGKYPYPRGYANAQTPSAAGGGEGGNPDLYTALLSVQATLTNTGAVAGACVVQLYVTFPRNLTNSLGEAVAMPPRQLRNWQKTPVVGTSNKAKRTKIDLQLTRKDLSFWDVGLQNWVLPDTRGDGATGQFEVALCFSSRDCKEIGRF